MNRTALALLNLLSVTALQLPPPIIFQRNVEFSGSRSYYYDHYDDEQQPGRQLQQKHLVSFLLLSTSSTTSSSTTIAAIADSNDANSGSVDFNLQSILLRANQQSIQKDEVVRIIDANTIKLKRSGLVTLAAVQTPSGYNDSNFRFPDCFTKSPSSKLRQLLPKETKVSFVFADVMNNSAASSSSSSSRPKAVFLQVEGKSSLVNTDLVREGFAKPILSKNRVQRIEGMIPGYTNYVQSLQAQAKERGVGMYKSCDGIENIATDDQFEDLDVVTEIQFGDDGGKVMLKYNDKNKEKVTPLNPGDKRGCSDFRTYEDALRYYETYYPYYGDVAKLDRDGDGIPCSGLPHTTDQSKYRVKKKTVMFQDGT